MMGEAKRRRKKAKASEIDLPISDKAEITTTTIYSTIDAMFAECIASKSWFEKYSPGTQRTIKFAFYGGISEALRTVIFRMNADQSDAVFADFDRELRTYDLELQRAIERADAELH